MNWFDEHYDERHVIVEDTVLDAHLFYVDFYFILVPHDEKNVH